GRARLRDFSARSVWLKHHHIQTTAFHPLCDFVNFPFLSFHQAVNAIVVILHNHAAAVAALAAPLHPLQLSFCPTSIGLSARSHDTGIFTEIMSASDGTAAEVL